MAKEAQAGQIRTARQWLALLGGGSFALMLSIMTGCSSTPTTASQDIDPLTGNRTPPGRIAPPANPSGATNVAPTASQTSSTGPAPGIPVSQASSNPANLAGTSWQRPLGRPLAIDDNNSSGPSFLPAAMSTGSKSPQPAEMPNPNPKVEKVPDITPPVPVQSVPPTSSWQGNQPTGQSAAPSSSADLLTKRLQERGVTDQKQTNVPEGVHLTCYVSAGSAGGVRILEVTAADYATAAQAILQQLDVAR